MADTDRLASATDDLAIQAQALVAMLADLATEVRQLREAVNAHANTTAQAGGLWSPEAHSRAD